MCENGTAGTSAYICSGWCRVRQRPRERAEEEVLVVASAFLSCPVYVYTTLLRIPEGSVLYWVHKVPGFRLAPVEVRQFMYQQVPGTLIIYRVSSWCGVSVLYFCTFQIRVSWDNFSPK